MAGETTSSRMPKSSPRKGWLPAISRLMTSSSKPKESRSKPTFDPWAAMRQKPPTDSSTPDASHPLPGPHQVHPGPTIDSAVGEDSYPALPADEEKPSVPTMGPKKAKTNNTIVCNMDTSFLMCTDVLWIRNRRYDQQSSCLIGENEHSRPYCVAKQGPGRASTALSAENGLSISCTVARHASIHLSSVQSALSRLICLDLCMLLRNGRGRVDFGYVVRWLSWAWWWNLAMEENAAQGRCRQQG